MPSVLVLFSNHVFICLPFFTIYYYVSFSIFWSCGWTYKLLPFFWYFSVLVGASRGNMYLIHQDYRKLFFFHTIKPKTSELPLQRECPHGERYMDHVSLILFPEMHVSPLICHCQHHSNLCHPTNSIISIYQNVGSFLPFFPPLLTYEITSSFHKHFD